MKPPPIARFLLAALLAPGDRRFALADLDAELVERADRDGRASARRWYRTQAARSLLPLLKRRFRVSSAAPKGARIDRGRRRAFGVIVDDARYALRTLAQAPLVAVTTILSLGVGIALATTAFTVANAMILRPSVAPSTHLDRLAVLYTSQELGDSSGTSSFPDYLSLVESSRLLGAQSAFADLAAYRMGMMTLEGGQADERVMVELVTGNYFDVLGVPIALGRGFEARESRVGAADTVAVISHRLWQERFGGDPGALGSTVVLDGTTFVVIGVAPDGLTGRFLSLDIDAWLPLGIPGGTYHATPEELADRDDREYGIMAHLRDGATIDRAQAEAARLAETLHEGHAAVWQDDVGRPRRFTVLSERSARVPPDARVGVYGFTALIVAVVAMVLFITCSNVAGMFFARAARRGREMAIRRALGAGNARIAGMLMVESILVGLASGAFGLVLATQATRGLESMPFPLGLALRFDFSVDFRVLAFVLLVSLATSVVFGLAPALEASRRDLASALRTAAGDAGGRPGRFSLRNLLVIGQVAFSLVFLVSAGLMVQALRTASATDIGIDPHGIVSMTKFLPSADYPGAAAADYFDQLEQRLAEHPDVEEVHTTLTAEMSIIASIYRLEVGAEGLDLADGARAMIAYNAVTPGYLEMLGVRLLGGRSIQAADRVGAPRVAVVNEAFATRFLPGEGPIGKSFRVVGRRGARNRSSTDPQQVRVVGVAADGSYGGVDTRGDPYVWLSIAQDRTPNRFVHVRARGGTRTGTAVLRDLVPMERGETALIEPTPYEELIGFQYQVMFAASQAFAWLGAFASLLAAVGIYGSVSFAVGRRLHEMAVRRALGAMPRQVLGLVVGDGMVLATCGLAVGALLALPVAGLLAAEFSEVSALDPLAVGGSLSLLFAVSLAATLYPARRVLAVHPMRALRDE